MLSRAECCNWKRLLTATPSACFMAQAFCLPRLAGYVLESCRRNLRIFHNAVVINTNTSAIGAKGNVSKVWDRLKKTMSRLSSGNKIVEPQDDAAGLAVSSRLDSKKYRNLSAITNLQNAVSFVQTQNGYLNEVASALERMSELTLLAQDATKSNTDRELYDKEFQELKDFVNSTVGKTFNGVAMFQRAYEKKTEYEVINVDGGISWTDAKVDAESRGGNLATITSASEKETILDNIGGVDGFMWIGATDEETEGSWKWVTGENWDYTNWSGGEPNNAGNEDYAVAGWGGGGSWNDLPNSWGISRYLMESSQTDSSTGGLEVTVDGDGNTFTHPLLVIPTVSGSIATTSDAATALPSIKTHIQSIANSRGKIGSTLGRIEYEMRNLHQLNENLESSISRITDLDIAEETTKMVRDKILSESSVISLKKASDLPKNHIKALLDIK